MSTRLDRTVLVMVKIFEKQPKFFNDSGKMDKYMGQTIEVNPGIVQGQFGYYQPSTESSTGSWCYLSEHVILDPSIDENDLKSELGLPSEKKPKFIEEG